MLRSSGIVRIAVVGDEGTGKTSLISTAANDTFDVRPPPVLPPTKLPPEFNQDQTPMLITDTSSRPEDVPVADIVIQQADVVVVCFDPKRHSTLDSIRSIWYPRIQQLKPDMPVIIACCKADTIQEEREQLQLRERVEIAVHDLPHVEVCLNCSSKTLRVVADIFSYALQSVLYPLHPLYDRMELCLTKSSKTFPRRCFDIPLLRKGKSSRISTSTEGTPPATTPDYHFICECFFITVKALNLGRATWCLSTAISSASTAGQRALGPSSFRMAQSRVAEAPQNLGQHSQGFLAPCCSAGQRVLGPSSFRMASKHPTTSLILRADAHGVNMASGSTL
eukprot:gene32469-17870_t